MIWLHRSISFHAISLQVKEVSDELGIAFLGLGFHPTAKREDIPIMPKGRYDIMRAYMPKVGTLGLEMMLRTCTIQVRSLHRRRDWPVVVLCPH